MLVEIISSCGQADRELDSRVEEFDGFRDLVMNAGSHLDELTQAIIGLTVRIPQSKPYSLSCIRNSPRPH